MPDPTPLAGLKLELALSSGIPEALAATLNYARVVRETMNPEVRDRFDRLNLALAEAFWYDVIRVPRPPG